MVLEEVAVAVLAVPQVLVDPEGAETVAAL
jgi:hypothetical protein